MNSQNSWSRCAAEFITSKDVPLTRELDESVMRPIHVKRLDFNKGLSSCRGLVATDVTLASLEQIETNELVTKWIADGICTPPTSERNASSHSSPIVGTWARKEELFDGLIRSPEKSPVIKFRRKSIVETSQGRKRAERVNKSLPDLSKSPIIGKRQRNTRDEKFNSWDKRQLDESGSLSPNQKSPKLGRARFSVTKHGRRMKRKKLQDQLDSDTTYFEHSYYKRNQTLAMLGFHGGDKSWHSESKEFRVAADTRVNVGVESKLDGAESSQDLFDEQQITSPKPVTITISSSNEKEEKDLSGSCKGQSEWLNYKNDKEGWGLLDPESKPMTSSWENNKYSSSPVFKGAIKVEKKFCMIKKNEEESFESIIQDTEELLVPKSRGRLMRRYPDSNPSGQDEKFTNLDSEFSRKKKQFVTDTEHIDYNTSSENEDNNPGIDGDKISTGEASDSDKTVSDIIEEPTTQDYLELPKPTAIISCRSDLLFSSSLKSMSANSPKISEIVSPKELISPQISVVDISMETTPPRTQESSSVPAAGILDSGKKKKSKPKKGSLSARLQKLINGQVSCVRLWRHQMSRESASERTSAPCTTLLVVDTWMQYGKNFYRSKVLDDPYNLLNNCLDAYPQSKDKEKEGNWNRNLFVMTNPDFVGAATLLTGTVFKIYLPWDVFNRNSGRGNLILHVLYFQIVSNRGEVKLEPNAIESQVGKYCKESIDEIVTRDFHCPCLQNGKINDSCFVKFTNEKIDIISEIIKQ